jgi:hypothetical protein
MLATLLEIRHWIVDKTGVKNSQKPSARSIALRKNPHFVLKAPHVLQ